MTSQNEEAEELMRKIEKEEDQMAFEEPDKKYFHHCIINLVIGYVLLLYYKLNLKSWYKTGLCTARKEIMSSVFRV